MSRVSVIDQVGFSLSKDRLTIVFLEGRVTDNEGKPYGVNIRIVDDKIHVVKHRGGMLGSKYKLHGNVDAWSYQVMLKSVAGADILKGRYPNGVSMTTIQQIRQFGEGKTAMFALPDPDDINPAVQKVLNGPKRTTPRLTETHHGSNGGGASDTAPIPTPKVELPTSVKIAAELVDYGKVGMDFDSAVGFLNSLKSSFGENFSMTVRENGMLYAAFLLEAGPREGVQ